MSDKNCTTCKYSKKSEPNPATLQSVLQCRRYPPQLIPVQGPMGQAALMPFFPTVDAQVDCGEYTPTKPILTQGMLKP